MDRPLANVAEDLTGLVDLVGSAGNPERELLPASLAALSHLVPHDVAAVLRLERSGEHLEVLACSGPRAREGLTGTRVALDTLPLVEAALSAGTAQVDGEEVGALGVLLYGDQPLRPQRSTLLVPLLAGSRRLGLLVLDADRPGLYPPDLPPVAAMFGQLIALGLRTRERVDRLRLYKDRLAEYARLLEHDHRAQLDSDDLLDSTRSPAMKELLERARQVAASQAPVLVLGETGVGKEVVARAIHRWSERRDGPFVAMNCGALAEDLIESELFGHIAGAFTGASSPRQGRFAIADGGTLLLDEIGEMPPSLQVKLLRVLQHGAFEPVGSDRTVTVSVRVIAATHVDLTAAVQAGTFREDLYYRLAVFPLLVPPLRERREDIPALTRQLLNRARSRAEGAWVVPPDGMQLLQSHDWPGNVRELENTLERALIRKPGGGELEIELDPLQRLRKARPIDDADDWPTMDVMLRRYLRRVLARTRGQIWGAGGAAEILGVKPTTLKSRLERMGIDKSEFEG